MPNVAITDRAQVAIRSLNQPDRDQVLGTIDRLRFEGANPSGVPQVYRVRGPAGAALNVLRATPTLRVLFSEENGVMVIQDVVNHDIVAHYFRTAG